MQSVACWNKKSSLAVTVTANKMNSNNKSIVSKSTGSGGIHRLMYHTSINVSYIRRCIIHHSALVIGLPSYSTEVL